MMPLSSWITVQGIFKRYSNKWIILAWRKTPWVESHSSVGFLDLTVSINTTGSIEIWIFQKAMNLYLYRCPPSAQPVSILQSLIYGTLHQYYWQNTNMTDFGRYTELFFEFLTARAHNKYDLAPMFIKVAKEAQNLSLLNPRPGDVRSPSIDKNNLLIHLPYHLEQPLRKSIRDHTNTLLE